MTPLINKVATRLIDNLEDEAKSGNEIDVRVKFGKFALDTMASCAFGVDPMSFTNKNSEFVQNATKIFKSNKADMLKVFLLLIPGGTFFMRLLGISIFKTTETLFFYDVVKAAVLAR